MNADKTKTTPKVFAYLRSSAFICVHLRSSAANSASYAFSRGRSLRTKSVSCRRACCPAGETGEGGAERLAHLGIVDGLVALLHPLADLGHDFDRFLGDGAGGLLPPRPGCI